MKIFVLTKKTLLLIITIIIVLFSILTFCEASSLKLNFSAKISSDNNFIDKITNYSDKKTVYLTFDDGPTLVTPKILDILKEENIKATFFVIGKSVKEHPQIVKRAYEEGHYIANHSYNHNNSVLYKNSENFIDEIKKTDLAIGNAIGVENYCSHLFRFPNGFMSPSYKSKKNKASNILLQMNYFYLDWNCLNNDSMKKYSNSQLLENLKKSCKNRTTLVVLMHDTKDVSNSSLVLKDSISYLKSQGYEFGDINNVFKSIEDSLK